MFGAQHALSGQAGHPGGLSAASCSSSHQASSMALTGNTLGSPAEMVTAVAFTSTTAPDAALPGQFLRGGAAGW
jgi:hypothetical protein